MWQPEELYMEEARENVMSVVSVSDPKSASKIGTRTWAPGSML
jgi:hypothetical protein